MNPLWKKVVLGVSILVVAYVATGYMLGRSTDDKAFRALTVYSEVLEHIQRDYVDDPNMRAVTNGSLHGLLDSLDPQSAYLSPLEYKDYKEKSASNLPGEAGLALTRRFGYIGVIGVLPDSPGAKIGLRIGDILEKIAGFTTGQMAIDQAQLLLKGNPGTTVPLSVIRRGKAEPQEMTITLAKLATPKLVEDKLAGDIAYLRVVGIYAGTAKQIREKLVQFAEKWREETDSRSARLRSRRRPGRRADRAAFPFVRHDCHAERPDGHDGRLFRRSGESSLEPSPSAC